MKLTSLWKTTLVLAATIGSTCLVTPQAEASGEVTVYFQNDTRADLQLFWVNYEGQLVPHDKIESFTRRTKITYIGHTWVVMEPSTKIVVDRFTVQQGGYHFITVKPALKEKILAAIPQVEQVQKQVREQRVTLAMELYKAQTNQQMASQVPVLQQRLDAVIKYGKLLDNYLRVLRQLAEVQEQEVPQFTA